MTSFPLSKSSLTVLKPNRSKLIKSGSLSAAVEVFGNKNANKNPLVISHLGFGTQLLPPVLLDISIQFLNQEF